MSWLSGLAGKAEDLLNKVDQQAAKTLNTIEDEHMNDPTNQRDAYSPYLGQQTTAPASLLTPAHSQMNTSASVPANLNKYTSQRAAPAPRNSTTTTPNGNETAANRLSHTPTDSGKASPASHRKSKDKDQELFDFLNSDSPVESNAKSLKPWNNGAGLSRHSSSSSIASSNRATESASVAVPVNGQEMSRSQRDGSEPGDHIAVDLADDPETNGSSSGYHSTHDSDEGVVSSLELENRLLKNEIASLNQEMSTVIQRSRTAQEELSKIRNQQSARSSQLSQSDQMIRELQSRESDLTEALGAKDSQLAVLRVRIEESDKELVEKRRLLDNFKTDRDRILADHTSSSDVHNQALESVKDKLSETETLLQREKEAARNYQVEVMKQQSKYETDHQSLADSLSMAQRKLTEQKGRFSDLNIQLKTAKSQADSARQDLIDYKDKAARILLSKDKLITSLKEGSGIDGDDSGVSFAELEELRHERDMLKDEVQQTKMNMQQLRSDLQDTEIQLQTESDNAHDEAENMEEQLNTQKQLATDLQADCNRQKQELRYAHEELLKQKTSMQGRLEDRDVEIERLRKQLMTKSVSSTSESELENRLHALTESLIHKQTMLEALSTEKNSLGLQLERIERQHREEQAMSIRSHTHTVALHEDEEVRQRLPAFLKESPGDNNVIRGVKRTAGTIDRFSIRLGVFLRRYPIARVFVILYMALLHLWVTVVMLTYQPEVHGPDYMLPREPRDFH